MKAFFKRIGRGIWSFIKRGGAMLAGTGMVAASWIFSTSIPATEAGINMWVGSGAVPATVTILNPWLLYPGLALLVGGFIIYMMYGRSKKEIKHEELSNQQEVASATA